MKLAITAIMLVLPGLAMALPRASRQVTGTWQDDGNAGIMFNTSCPSTNWTPVVTSTDSIRRAMKVQTDVAGVGVCLSSSTDATTCGAATVGMELNTIVPSLIDYSGVNWFCRTRGGSVNIKGVLFRDSGDQGQVVTPR